MRPPITASSLGWCYLLHLSRPLGNLANPRAQAQHYSGWCEDLDTRIAEHLAGQGAKITRAAVAQGIEISLVATWRAPLAFEKYLKRRKDAPRLCPICCREQRRRVRQIEVPTVEQLRLDLACPGGAGVDAVEPWPADFDFPAPTLTRPCWAEIASERRARALNAPTPVANFDDEI